MMNRRQLMCTGAAALFASIPEARAATYDLLIKGGRVIDPSVGLDAIRDIAIAGGKIVAVEADIAGDASQTIDARGKIVAPGLIDIHTHAGRSKEGPALLAQDGVTGWVDAGSAGADNIDQIATVARTGPQVGRALVNIARTGVVSPTGEQLVALAAHHKVPAMYEFREYVLAGGLVSYGVNIVELYREAAQYTAKILKGAKPGELPIMQPTKFDFLLNNGSAHTMSASARCSIRAAKAGWKSASDLASSVVARRPAREAASRTSRRWFSAGGKSGLMSTAITLALGTSSCSRPSRLPSISIVRSVNPVTLPPGRFMLATIPCLTGSPPTRKTTGIT
jgi:ABC transporter substrate binding protein